MRILLTGSSGFLGSTLIRFWYQRGRDLLLITRPGSDLRRLEGFIGRPEVLVICTTTPDEVVLALREADPEVIVHTARS